MQRMWIKEELAIREQMGLKNCDFDMCKTEMNV